MRREDRFFAFALDAEHARRSPVNGGSADFSSTLEAYSQKRASIRTTIGIGIAVLENSHAVLRIRRTSRTA